MLQIWKILDKKAAKMPNLWKKTEKNALFCRKWAVLGKILVFFSFFLLFFQAARAAESIPYLTIKDLKDINNFAASGKLPGSHRRNLRINQSKKIHPRAPLATQVPLLNIVNRSLGLNSPSWTESNPCDQWEGLECNNNFEVVKISLGFRFLRGSIPPSIGELVSLKELDLSKNIYLHGEIPSNLEKLKDLEVLLLNENSLSGTIPKSLVNLREAQFLDFSSNKLVGEIPYELQFLPKLQQIIFDNNVKLESPSEEEEEKENIF